MMQPKDTTALVEELEAAVLEIFESRDIAVSLHISHAADPDGNLVFGMEMVSDLQGIVDDVTDW